jgi:hypothetical protein
MPGASPQRQLPETYLQRHFAMVCGEIVSRECVHTQEENKLFDRDAVTLGRRVKTLI